MLMNQLLNYLIDSLMTPCLPLGHVLGVNAALSGAHYPVLAPARLLLLDAVSLKGQGVVTKESSIPAVRVPA